MNAHRQDSSNNYQIVRMSDLQDNLYSNDTPANHLKNQDDLQNDAENNKHTQKEKTNTTNNKVVKIKIKICDDGKAKQNEEHTDVKVMKVSINTHDSDSEQYNRQTPNKIQRFQSKTSNTTYMVQVLTEPAQAPYKVHNDNASTDIQTKNCGNVMRESENENCKMIDINENFPIMNKKKETIKTIENIHKPENFDHKKNEVDSIKNDKIQENNNQIYENFYIKKTDDNSNYMEKYTYKDYEDTSHCIRMEEKRNWQKLINKDSISSSSKKNYEGEGDFVLKDFISILSTKKEFSNINDNKNSPFINDSSATDIFQDIHNKQTIKSDLQASSSASVLTAKKDKEPIHPGSTIKNDNIKKVDNKYMNILNITDPKCNNKIPTQNILKYTNTQDESDRWGVLNSTYKQMQVVPEENSVVKTNKDLQKLNNIQKPQLKLEDETSSCNNTRRNIYSRDLKYNFLDDKGIKDSAIVKDLVIGRFGDIINQFRQKSLRRKQTRKSQSLFQGKDKLKQSPTTERPKSLDLKSTYENKSLSQWETKTPDSGLDTTNYSHFKSNDSLRDSDDETLKYSPTKFLKQALGDEYMNLMSDSQEELEENPPCSTPLQVPIKQYSTERSIGSSDISTLISTVDSLYSTVDKNRKKRSVLKKTGAVNRPLFSSTVSSNTCIYESAEEIQVNSKSEELKHEMFIQSAIIYQVLKALTFCRQSPTFFGSSSHLEAEKYLLFATQKKEIIEKELDRDYEEMESEQCCGIINVENLVFCTKVKNKVQKDTIKQYYICLIHVGTNLFVSDVVCPSKNGDIIFKKPFQFNHVASDFEMYIKVYSMKADNNGPKQKLFSTSTKLYMQRKSEKASINNIEESSFQLLGVRKIVISDLDKDRTFTFQKVLPEAEICNIFKADICSSIKVNNSISGFLTIGTSNILWNRRWCLLDGFLLKYWNYPNDENVKEPIEIINLSGSVNHYTTSADKVICSRPRTLTLIITAEQGDLKEYFLQADNILEFEEWKRQLNFVLISLKNWRYLKY